MSDAPFMYRLVFLEGPDKGRRVVIRQASVEAGAEPELRIRLDDPAAQEHHAVFIQDDGQVHVETSMEAQPFIRGGEPLGRDPLRHGDVLELGRLRIQYQVMQPLVFHLRRRLGGLNLLTILATVAILAVQGVLLGFALTRHHEGPLPEPLVTEDETEVAEESFKTASLLPKIPAASPETEAEVEDPVDDVFDPVDVVKPERLPDPVPTVIERPTEPVPAEPVDPEPEPEEPPLVPEPETSSETWIEPETPPVEKPQIEPDPPKVEVVERNTGPEKAPPLPDLGALPRRIRIAEVAREKFKPGPGLEEARGARVVVRPRRSLGEVNRADVRVDITFYDRDEFSGKVIPSLVPAASPTPEFSGNWPAGEAKNLQFRYDVPQGFRTGDTAGHTYYGHSVQLYYRGRLEDAYAFPESLLDF